MRRFLIVLLLSSLPAAAQEYKIAVVSMLHAHVWLHLGTMLKGDKVKLVGVSETLPDLIKRATREDVIPQTQNVTRPGVPENLIFSDWKKMIDQTKPDIVWAFTPTNGHVDVVRYCAPKGIHVIMEKPLAATLGEALEIQALARKHHILVLTNYGSTWQPAQYAIKAAVDAGEIGPVWRLHGVQGHNGPGDPQDLVLRGVARRPGAERRRRHHGFRLLPRALEPRIERHAGERIRHRATYETGHVPQGGRQRHHRPEL